MDLGTSELSWLTTACFTPSFLTFIAMCYRLNLYR